MGLAVGLLAAAITGGAVLTSGGDGAVNGAPDAEEVVVKDGDVSLLSLTSGGDGAVNGAPDAEEVVVKDGDVSLLSIENTEVEAGEPDELSARVAEILGTDPQATHDAMVQADQVDPNGTQVDGHGEVGDADSMSVEAEGLSYLEYGGRIGAILKVDGLRVAQAIAQAYEELYEVVRDIQDKGSGRDAEGKYEAEKHPAERSDTGG